jgi:translation initiation factor 1A
VRDRPLCFTSSTEIVSCTVKAYGELPENAKINETDPMGEEEGECGFEFGDDDEVDIDDI